MEYVCVVGGVIALFLFVLLLRSNLPQDFNTLVQPLNCVMSQYFILLTNKALLPYKFAGGEIPTSELVKVRKEFVEMVLRSLTPSYKRKLLDVFSDTGLVMYVCSWFDNRLMETGYVSVVGNVGEAE